LQALASGLELLAKSGAIVSAAGVALLVTFVVVLLVFPVTKTCVEEDCTFSSSAQGQLQLVFSPAFLALSLLVIAGGIVMMRYSRWRESKQAA
jgi:hypothetical protein